MPSASRSSSTTSPTTTPPRRAKTPSASPSRSPSAPGTASTSSPAGDQRQKLREASDGLDAGGWTAGGEGITLAYRVAERNFQKGAVNRVILGTDGDFNVGLQSEADLVRLIEQKRKSGVFLTIL